MAWNDETILQESPVLLAELEQLELNNLEGFDFTDPPAGPEVPGGMDEGAIGGTPAEQILAVLPDPITAQLLAQVGQDVAPGLSALMVTSVPSSDFPCEDGGGDDPGEVIPYETPEGDPSASQVEQPVTQFGLLASDVADDLADAMQGVLSPGLDQAGVNCWPWCPTPAAPTITRVTKNCAGVPGAINLNSVCEYSSPCQETVTTKTPKFDFFCVPYTTTTTKVNKTVTRPPILGPSGEFLSCPALTS